MAKLQVHHDREGNSISVWLDDPKKEHMCEEADDDMILIKEKRGNIIGFERLNYLSAKSAKQRANGENAPLEAVFS